MVSIVAAENVFSMLSIFTKILLHRIMWITYLVKYADDGSVNQIYNIMKIYKVMVEYQGKVE